MLSAGLAQGLEVDRSAGRVDDLGVLEHQGERLAADDLADDRGTWPASTSSCANCVRRHAVARGLPDEVLGELGLVDRELLLLGDLVEHELRGEAACASVGVELGSRWVLVAVTVLEVRLDLGLDDGSPAAGRRRATAAPRGPCRGPRRPARAA